MFNKKMKMSIVGVMLAGLVGFTAVNSFAAEETLTANITLDEAVKISNPVAIDFGTIEKPETLVTLLVTPFGTGTRIDGTATRIVDPTTGSVTIGSSGRSRVTMSATQVTCSDGLSFIGFSFSPGVFTTSSVTTVRHGAGLRIDGTDVNLSSGSNQCTYTITAAYN